MYIHLYICTDLQWEYYEGKVAHFLLIPLNYTNDYNFVLEKLLAQDPFFVYLFYILFINS